MVLSREDIQRALSQWNLAWRTGKDEEKLCRSMNTNVSRVGR